MIQAPGGTECRPDGPPTIRTEHVHLRFAASGLPRRMDVLGLSIPLYPAGDLEDGLAGLYLRIHTDTGIVVRPLVGLRSGGRIAFDTGGAVTTTEHPGRLVGTVALRTLADAPGWVWQVHLRNDGDEAVRCDVVAVQDVALAPYGAVRTNEYYVCQYLDVTAVPVDGHGTALAVRQNMPGERQPWAIVGCTGVAAGWATDALQLTGRDRLDGEPLAGLLAGLPAERLQHEHTVTALQTEPLQIAPGAGVHTAFYGLVLADHPDATTDDDARWARQALADRSVASSTLSDKGSDTGSRAIDGSLFHTAAVLACRESAAPTGAMTTPGAVTAAEQRAVLRPHGHLMRTGSALVPDERTVTTTCWMAGTFLSQVTQGHASAGGILSVRRSYLGLFAAHGLRIFVAPATATTPGDPDWRLLGTPSRWAQELDRCRWEYLPDDDAVAAGFPAEIVVEVSAPSDAHELRVTVAADAALRLLVSAHFVGAGDDGAEPGPVVAHDDSAGCTVEVGDGTVRLDWPSESVTVIGGSDNLRRSLDGSDGPEGVAAPYLTLLAPSVRRWALTLTPHLVPSDAPTDGSSADLDPSFWTRTTEAIRMAAPAGGEAAQELSRIEQILPWFAHDALIHYLSPRGLEQFTGGAWGTRDVSQGPVGLLLAWGEHEPLREVCGLLLRAQQSRGDWPQAFEFYPRYVRNEISDAHGDVVYWPLLAIGEYLAATGDASLLQQTFPFVGDGAPTEPADTLAHLAAALDFVSSTLIAGTALPAYGHGDWNDSLQPADPELAARLCSSWTVVLQTHALRTLADALAAIPTADDRTRQLAQRARAIADSGAREVVDTMLADDVLAGYGFFGDAGFSGDAGADGPELLVHPSDTRTGLRYSVLPMIHAISGELLDREQAAHHLQLIRDHLTGPDGARLFDRPAAYHGGPMHVFQRAEAATFFGREIGIMYTHAHLRYAEALARFGDAAGFLRALALANPIGMTDRVPSARPRQQTTYYSSSDGAFADRAAAAAGYAGLLEGAVALEGGWRVYSSGPGIYLRLVRENLLGIRQRGAVVEIDPVLDPALGEVAATVGLLGGRLTIRYRPGPSGAGVGAVRLAGRELEGTPLQNRYRAAGLAVPTATLQHAVEAAPDADVLLEVDLL